MYYVQNIHFTLNHNVFISPRLLTFSELRSSHAQQKKHVILRLPVKVLKVFRSYESLNGTTTFCKTLPWRFSELLHVYRKNMVEWTKF